MKGSRLMRYFKSIILILVVFFLAACGEDIETNMSENVADFDFTTQDKGTLSLDDLEGEWWVADFVFTNCTTVCLPMTSNMSVLQDKMKEEELDAQLVSFSVDPDYDTPEVLQEYADEYDADLDNWTCLSRKSSYQEYADEYDADLDNWTFLTGYDFQTIKELSIKS